MEQLKAFVYKRGSLIDTVLENQWQQMAERVFSDGVKPEQCLFYEDLGVTRSEYTRPALKRLEDDIKAGIGDVLYCSAIDRLGDSVKENIGIMDLCQKHGVRFVAVLDNLDIPAERITASDEFRFNLITALARFEHRRISERCKAAKARRRALGLFLGRKPGAKDNPKRPRKKDGYFKRYQKAKQDQQGILNLVGGNGNTKRSKARSKRPKVNAPKQETSNLPLSKEGNV